jgi:hypothetical protein
MRAALDKGSDRRTAPRQIAVDVRAVRPATSPAPMVVQTQGWQIQLEPANRRARKLPPIE